MAASTSHQHTACMSCADILCPAQDLKHGSCRHGLQFKAGLHQGQVQSISSNFLGDCDTCEYLPEPLVSQVPGRGCAHRGEGEAAAVQGRSDMKTRKHPPTMRTARQRRRLHATGVSARAEQGSCRQWSRR